MTESPMDYMNIRSKVMASYSAFGAFNSNLGAMKSWECKITQKTKANANPTHPYLDVCVLNLELPADWDYSGSFNLTLGFDAFSATVTSLKYEWVK